MPLIKRAVVTLFPRACIYCEKPLAAGYRSICQECANKLISLSNYCPLCGTAQTIQSQICGACQHQPSYIDQLILGYAYTGMLQELIIKMKFSKKPHIADFCAEIMLPIIKMQNLRKETIIIPIPSDRFRLAARGFNPAFEIAQKIASFTQCTLNTRSLTKRPFAIPQSQLERKSRLKNLNHILKLNAPVHSPVLLVDDVYTTGTTINQAAKLLKQMGTPFVTAIIVARA